MESGDGIDDRLAWAMRTAMSRDARPEELAVLRGLYETQFERYADAPDDARALLASRCQRSIGRSESGGIGRLDASRSDDSECL